VVLIIFALYVLIEVKGYIECKLSIYKMNTVDKRLILDEDIHP